MQYRILIVDDEKNIRKGIREFLEETEQYEVIEVSNGKEAIGILEIQEVDLILSDLKMGPTSGEQLLQHVVSRYPSIPVIILTGHGSVETAVDAIQKGAYDFLTKPVNLNRLLILFKRALQTRALALQNRRIQEELYQHSKGIELASHSRSMQKIMEKVGVIATANSVILITGESGVGKELLCNQIHMLSSRKLFPLIKVHCAALSESLLESELFGHEKGAFTGAISQKKGRFELADGGTIFLDEIGEIDNNIQVKLLRVLQEQEFERVGGEKTIRVDVRIITATNKNLKEEVDNGRFREDLYYRLNVLNIHIPPLRERREDILRLALGFLQLFNKENNKHIEGFSKQAITILSEYDWPGNIRELRNCIESTVVMATSKYIEAEDLPDILIFNRSHNKHIVVPVDVTLRESEKQVIHATLLRHKWNISKTAEILGIGRTTLHTKINEYHLKHEKQESTQ